MRTAEITRKTAETDITVSINLDGGVCEVNTGIGFFDHMLCSFAKHGKFGLKVQVKGDLYVDGHHTVEDTGIVLGKAFLKALGDKVGIERFADTYIPMDESLAFCACDISGRPFLHFDAVFMQEHCGDYDTALSEEFFRGFAMSAEVTLHLRSVYGVNAHHQTEALFKAAGRALCKAAAVTGNELPSTKGVL